MRIVETWDGTKWVIHKGMLPLGQYVIRVRDSNAPSRPRGEARQPHLLQIVRKNDGNAQSEKS